MDMTRRKVGMVCFGPVIVGFHSFYILVFLGGSLWQPRAIVPSPKLELVFVLTWYVISIWLHRVSMDAAPDSILGLREELLAKVRGNGCGYCSTAIKCAHIMVLIEACTAVVMTTNGMMGQMGRTRADCRDASLLGELLRS